MNSVTRLFLALIVLIPTYVCIADTMHGVRGFTSPFPNGTPIPILSVTVGNVPVVISDASQQQPIILVRYLGYGCAHCVEQLSYLNRYASELKGLGIRVIAFSEDEQETCRKLVKAQGYDTSVLTIASDTDNAAARQLQALRVENDTTFDLHMSMVVHRGEILFAAYTEQPFMDIERLVAVATSAIKTAEPNVQSSDAHPTDKYLTGTALPTVIAGPADGIRFPVDLDFNRSPLHPTDLWVVVGVPLTSTHGESIAIIHNATNAASRTVRIKQDSRASHFMWRTHAIAMGSNGTFATAQNGQPGSGSPFYQFMGPTLWSSDTAVFASRYQTDNTMLASHLDMLHQSPQNLGIAHDHDNVYWVSDSYYNDVARYDFRDPHEVGGTDHRDGIIRRYTDVRITGGLRGEPGHLALHKQSGWLYIVDPGANRVLRLQTTSGHYTKTLFPPDESMEYLAEYSEYNGADVEVVVADGIGEPVGIEVDNNRLFVGDRSTGQIYIFRITDTGVEPLGTVQTGAEELMGICYGPDQRLWFVDRAQGTVNRLETTSDHSLTPVVDVTAVATEDVIRFRYTNASATTREVQFKGFLREATADGYGSVIPFQNITPVAINGNSTVTVPVSVVLPDTTSAWEVTLVEDDGSAVGGIRASTTVVPRNVRRIIADDALMETFRITEAVRQTNREGYMSLRSDVFIRVADSLKSLQTVLWNGGSFGEISVADDAVINSLLDRGIEVMLIADDPLLQRLDLPNANGFFRRFGIRLAGADTRPSDEGQRILFGIHGDTISGAFGLVDCQLPRLDHARGNNFIPNVYFQAVEEGCVPVFNGNYLQRVQTARYEAETYKSVIHGMNAERFLNGLQRTEFLDKALMWLETQVSKDTTIPDTTVSVKEDRQPNAVTVSIAGNVSADAITISVVGTSPQAVIAIYAPTGQRMADLHEGPLTGNMVITQNIRTLPFGTYFVVVTTPDGVRHSTFQKQ